MRERKWTKGPWAVTGPNGSIHSQAKNTDHWICQAPDVCMTSPPECEVKANANLIAAAPELYEALEKAVAAIEWWQEEHGCCQGATDGELEQAAAALAKARGETC